MKSRAYIFLLFIILIPAWSSAAEPNAGFVQGLWYSSEAVFAEVPTRIYVAVRNNTPHDLTAVVRFSDNGQRIGSSEVSILSGRLVEAWVDWTPSFGKHEITATVSNAEFHILGGETESIDIAGIIAEDTLVVDYDTDKDGIGNETDTDDDNDGISDTDEKTRGSNPLVPNPKEKTDSMEEKGFADDVEDSTSEKSTDSERGFEKYIGAGTVYSLLSNVTEKVENTKQSLDAYREKRNNEISTEQIPTTLEETIDTDTGNATITRSKIETKKNSLSSFISGISSLLKSIYTFVLWFFSRALSYPALIQFGLLLGILYTIYRVAKKIGRRPRN